MVEEALNTTYFCVFQSTADGVSISYTTTHDCCLDFSDETGILFENGFKR